MSIAPQKPFDPQALPPDALAQIEALKAENEALRAQWPWDPGAIRLRLSENGALSVYGLGRFPVTLYRSQWIRLLAVVDAIQAFLDQYQWAMSAKPWDWQFSRVTRAEVEAQQLAREKRAKRGQGWPHAGLEQIIPSPNDVPIYNDIQERIRADASGQERNQE